MYWWGFLPRITTVLIMPGAYLGFYLTLKRHKKNDCYISTDTLKYKIVRFSYLCLLAACSMINSSLNIFI